MKAYIHIGNHKTGSTTIQNSLKLKSEILLSKYGILYPQTFQIRNAHHLFPATFLNDKHIFGEALHQTKEMLMDDLKKEIEIKKPNVVVISSEEFFRFQGEDISKLDSFMNIFDEIEIIVYLRNQLDHIESSYKFGILWEFSRLELNFGDYLEHQLSSNYHCYDNRLLDWKKFFPPAKISVRNFDEEIQRGLLSNFYKSVLKIDFPAKESHDNQSLSRLSSIVLKMKNSLMINDSERENCINRLIKFDQEHNPYKKERIYTEIQYANLIKKFYDSNEILKKEFAIDLNKKMMNISSDLLVGENLNNSDKSLILSNINDISCIKGDETWLQI